MSKTVKVRIAVAVWAYGGWAAMGEDGRADDLVLASFEEDYDPKPSVIHWVTAEVPIPQPQEIAGEVGVGK